MDILFLCVANTARSQMAEGLARHAFGRAARIRSAGSRPTGGVHPMAVLVMMELGIDISSQISKSIDHIDLGEVDVVVTLCAEEVCPFVPGTVRRLHWPIPDPAATKGEREKLIAFRGARDELQQRIINLLHSPKTA